MRIKTPYISEIAYNTYAINEFGLAAMFLVIGSERALLLDTGVGLCDLPTIVRKLTPLPYDVVLTHGHGDHAGGIGHFSKIFVHPSDFEMVLNLDFDNLKGYNRMLGQQGAFEVYDYCPEAIKPVETMPELMELKEGMVFDLGGRRLSVIEVPGHTPGSCCLLDEKARILFSGDACNINLGIFGCPMSEALQNLHKLMKIRHQYDQNFNGHVGYIGNADCYSMPENVLETCIAICESILDESAQPEETTWFGGKKAFSVVRDGVRINYPG